MNVAVKRRSASRKKTQRVVTKDLAFSDGQGWLDEAVALLFSAAALFVFISFLSYVVAANYAPETARAAGSPVLRNLMGPAGHVTATMLWGLFGWCALVPGIGFSYLAFYYWRFGDERGVRIGRGTVFSAIGLVGTTVTIAAIGAVLWGASGGGAVGSGLSAPFIRVIGPFGASVVLFGLSVIFIAMATGESVAKLVAYGTRATVFLVTGFPVIVVKVCSAVSALAIDLWLLVWRMFVKSWLGEIFFIGRHREELAREASSYEEGEELLPMPRRRKNRVEPPAAEAVADEPDDPPPTHVVVERRRAASKITDDHFEEFRKKSQQDLKDIGVADDYPDYTLPELSLLIPGEESVGSENDDDLREKSRLIEAKLKDFSIQGRVTHVHPGPVITLFEFEPAPGVKVGRIAALADDLAMGLKASSIRIIAPIPRRGTVGIEVPNKTRDIVRLRDVLESKSFIESESSLSVPIGKDTYGEPVVVDISTMPHLLMAGATGTGKSVCINSLLLSLLYRASPAELGLILIDPKILELSIYEGIPHLRVPVVTVPRQAKAVLDWAVNEMNRRYRYMQKFGVRNIDSYNRIVAGEDEGTTKTTIEKDVVMLKEDEVVESGTVEPLADDEVVAGTAEAEDKRKIFSEPLKPLPKIVIVIDELADLMLTVGRDIEELVTRLAQKARAAGIHLIVATQRPSVDVITGLIKANFPARLSFRVSSRIDSRTILDSMGAEKLLGRGDMLFMVPGGEAVRRVHGAFVSDAEVKRVLDSIKAKCSPHYDQRIMDICEKALIEESNQANGITPEMGEDAEYDAMYDKCVELVVDKGQASTSMLQRAFRIGYNRAARIIDMMEKEGIVGPMDGAKPRDVLLSATDPAARIGDAEPPP